jgi:hypothetical protein
MGADAKKTARGTPGRLLTTDDVALRLGVSRHALEQWRGRGVGPPFIRVGDTRVRYALADLNTWLRQRVRRKTIAVACGRCGRGTDGGAPP